MISEWIVNMFLFSMACWCTIKAADYVENILNPKKETKVKRTLNKVMENTKLYTKGQDGRLHYPQMRQEKKTDYGHKLSFLMPLGQEFDDWKKRKNKIETALMGEVKMWQNNRTLYMEVMEKPLKKEYHFDVNAIENISECKLGLSVGLTRKGYFIFDMAEKQMNLIIAGYAGSGKSVTLRQMITAIMMGYEPEYVRMYPIDLKGGLELGLFENSPFVEKLAITHEETLDIINNLEDEMQYRYNVMRQEGVTSINDLPSGSFPYILTIIDEYAEITPSCLVGEEKMIAKRIENKLGKLLRMSRAAGIHLIFCTQRPDAEVINGQIRANIQAKIAHRVRDKINSRIIIDDNAAANLPPYPGRGIFQIQDNIEFQAPKLTTNRAKKLLQKRYKQFHLKTNDKQKVSDVNRKIKDKGVKL